MKPEPLILLAIEPVPAARDRLAATLQAIGLQLEIDVRADRETGRIVLGGWSEEQLRSALALLHAELPGQYNPGAMQVAYREGLRRPVELTHTHKSQSDGSGQFAEITVKVTPGERGSGFAFVDTIKGGNVPQEYIPSIEKGMREGAEAGSPGGFPIIDFSVELIDGKYHDIDSSALAFEICARACLHEAARKAGTRLLQPIMKVEVVTPEDYFGDAIGSINSRRGLIQGTDSRRNAQAVKALMPLAAMFGYGEELRSFSQGRAHHTMRFSHYEEMPDGDGPPDTEPTAAALRA